MSYLFISHSSKNNFYAIAIQDWLVAQGWNELFLDLDPRRGIVARQRWEKALHDAASRCDAVLFLVSIDWLKSDWCRKEFRLAHRLNKHIIGILIEDIDINTLPEELTSTWQLLNLASGNDHQIIATVHPDTGEEQHVHFSKAGLTRLKTGLVKAGLDPMFYQWPPEHDPERSPYRGMLPLEAEDAGIFFGREAPTNELLAKLRGLRADPPPRFMVVLGASGSGKSSFLRAGVLPRLSRDERNFVTLPIIRPEQAVLWGDNGLLSCLSKSCENYRLKINRRAIRKSIENNSQELIDLLLLISNTAKLPALTGETNASAPTLILTIDQGEELFHSEGSEQSKQLLILLEQLANHPKLPLIILFTIRSDSYERLQTHKSLEGISQQTFSLAPMPQGAYQAVIEGPAARLKETDRPLEIEPALTQKLLEDIEKGGNKDALPILAFTLERLYIDYGGDGDLRLDEYEDMGGLNGAIQAAVEIALKNAELDTTLPNERKAITDLLRIGLIPWLASIDPDSQTPRRRVAKLSEIPVEARPIINHLIEQRLLTTDTDDDNVTTIEPAHETLLRQWGLLKDWLNEDLAVLTILEAVQRASRDWADNNQDPTYLAHNAGRLQDAEGLKQREDLSGFLTKNDWSYLQNCREQEDQQRDKELEEAKKLVKAQKKVAKRTTMGMIAALVLTIIAGFMGWQSYMSEQLAEINVFLANKANEEAQEHLIEANHNYGLALYEKGRYNESEKNFNASNLYDANALLYVKNGIEKAQIASHLLLNVKKSNNVWSSQNLNFGDLNIVLAVSPNGKLLASGSIDNNINIWDLKTGKMKQTLTGTSNINSLVFSTDSKLLVSGNDDATIRIWDLISYKEKMVLQGHNQSVSSVLITKDSKTIISSSRDSTIKFWNIESGQQFDTLEGHTKNVSSIALTEDNSILASGSYDGSVKLWDLNSYKLIKTFKGHTSPVTVVLFSPNGKNIYSGSGDSSIRLWNIQKEKEEFIFNGSAGVIQSLSLTKDGKTLVSSSSENNIITLWNVESGQIESTLLGDGRYTNSIAITPDDKILISGSVDHIISLWDLEKEKKLTILNGHTSIITAVAISLDSKTLVSASLDNTIRVMNLVTGETLNVLKVDSNTDSINSIFFFPNGKVIVSAMEKSVRLWNIETGDQIGKLKGDFTKVTSVSVSPNGKLIALVSLNENIINDNIIQVWDVDNNILKYSLRGHTDFISNIIFTPNNKFIASSSYDNSIRIWDAKNGLLKYVLNGHSEEVNDIAFFPDNETIVSSSDDNTIRIWDIISGKPNQVIQEDTPIEDISISSNGAILSYLTFNNIHIFNIEKKEQIAVLLNQSSEAISTFTMSQDGKTLVTGDFIGNLSLWDLTAITSNNNKISVEKQIDSFSVSGSDEIIASVSYLENFISFWDIKTKKLISKINTSLGGIRAVIFSPDNKSIAFSSKSDKTVRVKNIYDGKEVILKLTSVYNNHLDFTSNGNILAIGSWDGNAYLWNYKKKKIKTLIGHTSYVNKIKFSPNDKILATTSHDNTIRLWDVETGETISILIGHTENVNSIVFSKDGDTLVSGSDDKTIRVWDVLNGMQESVLRGHEEKIKDITLSINGKILVSSSSDETIRLWDIESSDLIQQIKLSEEFKKLTFLSKGNILVASNYKSMIFFNLDLYQKLYTDINYIAKFIEKQKDIMNTIINVFELKLAFFKINLYGYEPIKPQWSDSHPFHWLEQANNGDSEAMFQLGNIYYFDSNNEKSRYWFKKSFNAGNIEAEQKLLILSPNLLKSISAESNHSYQAAADYLVEYFNKEGINVLSSKSILDNIEFLENSSSWYISWSWNMLFTENHGNIILSINKLFEYLNKDNENIIMLNGNLAHAYILSGNYDSAKTIYSKFKGQKFPDGREWNAVTLEDFKALKDEGIEHPGFIRIAKEVFGVDGFE